VRARISPVHENRVAASIDDPEHLVTITGLCSTPRPRLEAREPEPAATAAPITHSAATLTIAARKAESDALRVAPVA
jgi:hypothetical protein